MESSKNINTLINASINSYLGQKGYTISKNEISVEKQKKIRNDLTIKPYVPGTPNANNQPTFRIQKRITLGNGNEVTDIPQIHSSLHFSKSFVRAWNHGQAAGIWSCICKSNETLHAYLSRFKESILINMKPTSPGFPCRIERPGSKSVKTIK